jgi:hypothetical protein
MASTEEDVFESESLVEPKKLIGEYSFYLKEIQTKIGVRIYRDLRPPVASDPFYFDTSHAIHTPTQIGPYHPSGPWSGSAESALHRAVESLASYYKVSFKA